MAQRWFDRDQRLGALSFSLLALHPAVLAWRYAQVSWSRVAELWHPATGDLALLSGQVALYGMGIGMAITMLWTVDPNSADDRRHDVELLRGLTERRPRSGRQPYADPLACARRSSRIR